MDLSYIIKNSDQIFIRYRIAYDRLCSSFFLRPNEDVAVKDLIILPDAIATLGKYRQIWNSEKIIIIFREIDYPQLYAYSLKKNVVLLPESILLTHSGIDYLISLLDGQEVLAFAKIHRLTNREIQIVKELFLAPNLVMGLESLASKLSISKGTLKRHLHSIYAKTATKDRSSLYTKVFVSPLDC